MRHGQPKLFKSVGSDLPYDAEVEWLQNNDKSYIDTGIKLNQATDSMGCRFQPVSASATYCIFCGTRRGAYYSLNFSNNHVCFDYQSGGYLGTIQPENRNGLHTWECRVDEAANTASLFRDGKLITTRQRYRYATSANAWVFVANDEYRSLYGRVSEFWITRSGKYLIHLISVRFTNELGQSEGAMYDKVSGRLFRNSGTGSFIIGADKTKETMHGAPKNTVKPYDVEVEYLQSTGTQWIDTSIKCSQVYSVFARYMITSWTKYGVLFNSYINENTNSVRIITQDSNNGRGWASVNTRALGSLNIPLALNTWYNYRANLAFSDLTADINGTTYSKTMVIGNTNNTNVRLFGTLHSYVASFILYGTNGEVLRDFVPVRFLNEQGQQEGAMYDRANPTVGMDPDGSPRTDGLYRNRGTGAFTVGADKPEPVIHGAPKIAGGPYDAEVEYLQSTGSQRIDTGLKTTGGASSVNSGYQVEIEYRYTSKPRNDTWVFGYWNNVPAARLYLVGYYNGYRCGAGPDNTNYWCNIPYDSNFHVAKILNDGAYFDGVRKTATDLSGLGAHGDHGLWLFKSEHVETGGTRQVKYCKMWTIGGALVRDMIPVRFTNELGQLEGAMYDKVSGQLFRNKGTGNFVVGPDKT